MILYKKSETPIANTIGYNPVILLICSDTDVVEYNLSAARGQVAAGAGRKPSADGCSTVVLGGQIDGIGMDQEHLTVIPDISR